MVYPGRGLVGFRLLLLLLLLLLDDSVEKKQQRTEKLIKSAASYSYVRTYTRI